MLERLQRELKELIGQSRLEEVFALSKACLRSDCSLFNDVQLLAGSLSNADLEFRRNLIDAKELRTVKDKVSYALLGFIDQIRLTDLAATYKQRAAQHLALSNFHAYSCDRTVQNEEVQTRYYLNPEQKVRHFFLYGDAKQAHKSLFERFHRYFGGKLDNWQDPEAQPSTKVKVIECKPCRAGSPLAYQIEIIGKILGQCKMTVNTQQPLLSRKLSDLLASPSLEGFGEYDFVFVLLTVDDFNWNKVITPKVVEALLDGFCDCPLPSGAPSFFFFYGIEYQSNNLQVKIEVQQVVKERAERVVPLPELLRVASDDVNEWFSRYAHLIPKGKTAHDMSALLFGAENEFDMVDVEGKLLEIIELNNKGLLLETK